MLLLGASIVAYIIAHNLRVAEQYSFEQEQLEIAYAQESAFETALADMLFNGPRSTFANLPAETSYSINGVQMRILVEIESGKIDVNRADVTLIDRALRGFGVSASKRDVFQRSLETKRRSGQLLESSSELHALMEQSGIGIGNALCAADYFTVYSGLTQPEKSQMKSELSGALGQADLSRVSKARPGSALRITVQQQGREAINVVTRVSGLIGQSHGILDWSRSYGCDTSN